ncbi:methyltransferase [Hokovirus HKV1]|uniref:Methyltransferase n=1 Tax=Hokovirus HKV1 TaxID=1977638 RepID=A0A1V0SG39_9VIRU|nr:methyltransferase [Hokovirus HKV1]
MSQDLLKKENIFPYMTDKNYELFYKQWKQLIKMSDYKGRRTYIPITETNVNKAKDTKYAVYNAIKDKNDNVINPPDPKKESISAFLTRCGFNSFGGSSTPEHLNFHNKIMKKYNPRIIVEIGFNTGLSATNFLEFNPNNLVISFDLLMHHYTNYSKMYLDHKFPGRHILMAGDSTVNVPAFIKLFKHFKADLIFIDGSHSLEGAYKDIINCYNLAHDDTIMILDNTVPHRGVGVEVYDALLRAVQDDGIVNFLEHYETGDFKDGFAICKYNLKKENKFLTGDIDYVHVERRIECYYYTYKIQNTKDLETLLKLKIKIENNIKKNPDAYDMYIILELNKKMKSFGSFENMSDFKKIDKNWKF